MVRDWINWKTISTGIAMAIIGTLYSGVVGKTTGAYLEYRETVALVHSHMAPEEQERAKRNEAMLKQITKDIQDIKKASLTVAGYARVGTDARELYVMVNAISRAGQYTKAQRVRVTNLSSPDAQSVILKIRGTFSNNDESYLILVSRRAAEVLGISRDQQARIRIEPVVDGPRVNDEE
jgi:hypothetical protein